MRVVKSATILTETYFLNTKVQPNINTYSISTKKLHTKGRKSFHVDFGYILAYESFDGVR